MARNTITSADHELSTMARSLLAWPTFQQAVADHTEIGQLVHDIYRGDQRAEMVLYARYVPLLERISRGYDNRAAYDAQDAHQDGALALIHLARTGTETFARRIQYVAQYRVARAAHALSRPVTGHSRDQIITVREALAEADGDRERARDAVANHPKRNRRMKPETFDALVDTVLPEGGSLEEPGDTSAAPAGSIPEPRGGLGAADAAEYLAELLERSGLDDDEHEVLARAYGLAGYTPHTDTDLGRVYDVDRSAAGKFRRMALAKLRRTAREVTA